jgi:hypothetical protein
VQHTKALYTDGCCEAVSEPLGLAVAWVMGEKLMSSRRAAIVVWLVRIVVLFVIRTFSVCACAH